ncbi:ABC transporter substrate-binding protein [Chitinimonas koreensis]|uniref:ABC transporter substrate-binding protein n=1 Tax=Chitinimonas koreensis TaxID=356302 RepID=UPI0006846022|nr:ABC transporter substrate-binding protein [Chitinimonas koreensis]QNM98626.1 ABC transporter substrate-binding protein [Chitinimonas koreensis]
MKTNWTRWLGAMLLLGGACATDAPRPLLRVGFSVGSLANPFYTALIHGAEAQARQINPSVQLTTLASDYSLHKQQLQLRRFIADKVDLILLNAADPAKLRPVIRDAQAAGIVVVAVDVRTEGVDATVLTDNHQAGELACTYLANSLHGQGRVVIQSGPPVSSVTDRVSGCRSAFARFPAIKVLSYDGDGKASRWGGMQLMQTQLERFDDIDAVFAINDPQALGADIAARKAGRSRMIIASVDGAPDIEQALKSDSLIRASASQDPYLMARTAVNVGYDILNGKVPANRMILLPTTLVTRDNLPQYRGWNSR